MSAAHVFEGPRTRAAGKTFAAQPIPPNVDPNDSPVLTTDSLAETKAYTTASVRIKNPRVAKIGQYLNR